MIAAQAYRNRGIDRGIGETGTSFAEHLRKTMGTCIEAPIDDLVRGNTVEGYSVRRLVSSQYLLPADTAIDRGTD
jgi:hypothetical protein